MRKQWKVGKTLGLIPGRVTYVIDPEGVVRHVFSSQMKAAKHIPEALAVIRGRLRRLTPPPSWLTSVRKPPRGEPASRGWVGFVRCRVRGQCSTRARDVSIPDG